MTTRLKKSYWAIHKWKDKRKRPSLSVWLRAWYRQVRRTELDPNQEFLFICGLHRSGTSIIHECLRSHPGIFGFDQTGVPENEGQHLQTVMTQDIVEGGPGRFALSNSARLNESSSVNTAKNQEKLRRQWGRFLPISGKMCLEKSPPNVVRTRFLQSVFPRAKFLFVVRHPIPTSVATKRFSAVASDLTMQALLDHWEITHGIVIEDSKGLNDFRFMRYEDFVKEPIAQCRSIFQWLGLDEFDITNEVSDRNKSYFDYWKTSENFVECQTEGNEFENIARFGYSLTAPYVTATSSTPFE